MITKANFRKIILQYRMLIDGMLYQKRNTQLCEILAAFIDQHEVKKIHTFLSIQKNHEPNISLLFERLWAKEVQLVVSKTDFMFKQMRHYYLDNQIELLKNKMGIPEPLNANEASIDDLDMILVPLLVCDREGYRIGYGGGYYDRFLEETKALKVGLSLSPPVDRIIQTEKWDVPLDYLITPFKTYKYG